MDITPGNFEEFGRSSSSRSRRSETRSSMRSETTGSLEILPPEEVDDSDYLFMSEELTDEENDDADESRDNFPVAPMNLSLKSLKDPSLSPSPKTSSRGSTPNSNRETENIEDPELQKLIKKMKKYDKILAQKMKREKEVKLQRLLFQKQMLEDLASAEKKNEEKISANEEKFLALMPPPERVQEMLHQLENEEFVPIFPTQVNPENEEKKLSPEASKTDERDGSADDSTEKTSRSESRSQKSSTKKKIDFIKRNIELAKDAGNYVSMTDDEKTRLGELLADLDDVSEDLKELTTDQAFMSPVMEAGEGYIPDEAELKRLEEIDEKIQSLLPDSEFEMICGTPHFVNMKNSDIASMGEKIYNQKEYSNERMEAIQQRLETIDEMWKKTYEGTTPRLTDDQLQKLLDECSQSRCSMTSSLSLSTISQAGDFNSRPGTEVSTHRTETSMDESEFDDDIESVPYTPVVKKLSREVLDELLAEAKSSLGIVDKDSESDDEDHSSRTLTPLFHRIEREESFSETSQGNSGIELSLEEIPDPGISS